MCFLQWRRLNPAGRIAANAADLVAATVKVIEKRQSDDHRRTAGEQFRCTQESRRIIHFISFRYYRQRMLLATLSGLAISGGR